MTAATFSRTLWRLGSLSDDDAAARTNPPIAPRRGPVFIHDAVTPFRGETLLLSRLRADLEAFVEDDPG